MARWFHPANFAPTGSNWGHWKTPVAEAAWSKIDHAVDQKEMEAQIRIVHEQLVDDAPWLWIVHDLNPRAMSKKVKGFVSAQSWFQDFTKIDMQ
jgi:ABC-type transport system substrate-binding protein